MTDAGRIGASVCIADIRYIAPNRVGFPGGKPGSMAPPVVRMDGFRLSPEKGLG
jgi:hypothetical protein